jgi:hypothetical protein
MLAGLALSAGAQLAFALIYFGPGVMRRYVGILVHSANAPRTTELTLSPLQMHSLSSFWTLLIPWPRAVWVFYILSSIVVIIMATVVWKSSSPRAVRFSALILAAMLVDPHLYIYDLLALAPIFFLISDWIVSGKLIAAASSLPVLLYLAFVLPLFGPLSRLIHLQLSIFVFVALLWVLWRQSVDATKQVLPQVTEGR